jgi:hypothetical protein
LERAIPEELGVTISGANLNSNLVSPSAQPKSARFFTEGENVQVSAIALEATSNQSLQTEEGIASNALPESLRPSYNRATYL